MKIEELVALIVAQLKEDVVGMVSKEGNTVTIEFSDGTVRKISVS